MATPFSPFVGKRVKPSLNRRQSQLPSDLIDWDAPEIPELEKQRIIYEDYIKELKEENEENDIETLLNEQIFCIAHDAIVQEYLNKMKSSESETTKERTRVNLLLGQIKMFEENLNERTDELESAHQTIKDLLEEKNDLRAENEVLKEEKALCSTEIENLKAHYSTEIENLNFRNEETACELEEALKMFKQKKNEANEYKKLWQAIKERKSHYKKIANEEDQENK